MAPVLKYGRGLGGRTRVDEILVVVDHALIRDTLRGVLSELRVRRSSVSPSANLAPFPRYGGRRYSPPLAQEKAKPLR